MTKYKIEDALAILVRVSELEVEAGHEGAVGVPEQFAQWVPDLIERGLIIEAAGAFYLPTEKGKREAVSPESRGFQRPN